MRKKRLMILTLASVMAISMAGCGSKKEASTTTATTQNTTEATTTVTETTEPETTEPETTEPEVTTESETTTESEAATEATTDNSEAADAENDANPNGENVDFNKYIETTEVDPPLWLVTDPESGNSMYLLGTMHALPSGVTGYPADLMDIYNACDSIAVELDVVSMQNDMGAQMALIQSMLYDDGTTIKDHLSEDTYEKMKDYFTSVGMYNPLLNQYNVGFWVNLCDELMLTKIDNLELSGTDAYFINKAKEDGKEVIEIETMAIQGNALTAYSDELADYLLSKSIDNAGDIEGYAEDLANLYNVWASGSGEIMEEVEKLEEDAEELPEDLKDDEEAYNKIMLTDRNHGMAEKASEYLKEGKNCLFMVGAAHYGGEEGVDNLLEDMGYTVEKIE